MENCQQVRVDSGQRWLCRPDTENHQYVEFIPHDLLVADFVYIGKIIRARAHIKYTWWQADKKKKARTPPRQRSSSETPSLEHEVQSDLDQQDDDTSTNPDMDQDRNDQEWGPGIVQGDPAPVHFGFGNMDMLANAIPIKRQLATGNHTVNPAAYCAGGPKDKPSSILMARKGKLVSRGPRGQLKERTLISNTHLATRYADTVDRYHDNYQEPQREGSFLFSSFFDVFVVDLLFI